jgi:2-oxoglutarate dehydrogenase E1 component
MGAWPFLRFRFCNRLFGTHPFQGITRSPSASPATGSGNLHRLEQQEIINSAFE